MYLMLLVAISFPFLGSEFTLKNLVSIDKLESGTDAERIDELESALRFIDNYRFTATPTEFRLVACLLYTSPSPRDLSTSRMPSSA